MMCSSDGRPAVNAHARLATPGSPFVDLRDAGSQVKPHYSGRGHDGGDLAFLFLNIGGDLV